MACLKKAQRKLQKTHFPPPIAEAVEQNREALDGWFGNRPKRRRQFAHVMAAAARAPYSESRLFQHAHVAGSEVRDDWFSGDWMSREATLCTLLVTNWPTWERFPSVSALHDSFTRILTASKTGDLKSFHRLCRKIGLRLRGRGRPRKQK